MAEITGLPSTLERFKDGIFTNLALKNAFSSAPPTPILGYIYTDEGVLWDSLGTKKTITSALLAFDATTKKITLSTGSFRPSGFKVGMHMYISGSASNNMMTTVTNVTATEITVSDSLVTEAEGATVTLQANFTYQVQYNGSAYIGIQDQAGNNLVASPPSVGNNCGIGLKLPAYNLTQGKVYCRDANGYTLAAANAGGTMPAVGIADTTDSLLYHGMFKFANNQSWASGDKLWVASTAGNLTKTMPANSGYVDQVFGVALDDRTLLVQPTLWAENHA